MPDLKNRPGERLTRPEKRNISVNIKNYNLDDLRAEAIISEIITKIKNCTNKEETDPRLNALKAVVDTWGEDEQGTFSGCQELGFHQNSREKGGTY